MERKKQQFKERKFNGERRNFTYCDNCGAIMKETGKCQKVCPACGYETFECSMNEFYKALWLNDIYCKAIRNSDHLGPWAKNNAAKIYNTFRSGIKLNFASRNYDTFSRWYNTKYSRD